MSKDLTLCLIEAIAWWRLSLPHGRSVLNQAVLDLLLAGREGPAVVNLASTFGDDDSVRINVLIDRVLEELELPAIVGDDVEFHAARRMCRLVVEGSLDERELSRWVHTRFHHERASGPLNDLAVLDDDYDTAVERGVGVSAVRTQIRRAAARIVEI